MCSATNLTPDSCFMRAWAGLCFACRMLYAKKKKAVTAGGEKYFYDPDFVSAIAVLLKIQQYSWYLCNEPFIRNLTNL